MTGVNKAERMRRGRCLVRFEDLHRGIVGIECGEGVVIRAMWDSWDRYGAYVGVTGPMFPEVPEGCESPEAWGVVYDVTEVGTTVRYYYRGDYGSDKVEVLRLTLAVVPAVNETDLMDATKRLHV